MTAPPTLAIDASTYLGTVAVLRGETVVSEREAAMRGEHEERLMPAVAEALDAASVRVSELARVVCGGGPGSFTSLRIASSIAKGLCMAHGLPLFAVPSLALMRPAGRLLLEEGRWLALLDAMRGDVYATLLDVERGGRVTAASPPRLIAAVDVDRVAAEFGARPIGAGLRQEGRPRASALASVAPELIAETTLSSWEPSYGRLAEAQVRWEAAHGRALTAG
ncbi:MAG: tRNA (adenosine(37)-N6)-threonylcarbamoyltransferase complex dimerization subunit type 1 TsaB [Gemmatimonadaceae bacterium]|nr:tRNA (adenosine(37)-N6)-threonylcarbamoyltransferase complex dimerization subunit type 1 TsaB [Gemmatimonadaceae bacterium]NUR18152.1 tRNA (adenosine(37)-N6)-threonylcarbamoyltransferase complex dimerization subunit type 1 TsaB [Gemmatimonadaceae bacterium]NUS97168.1 tRNA (adenosine(37)-N6)-threonylcarbamoyltransferase complex dimerization subunit type 1 TsaB [Gemmatimonadaceae bacterium]